MATGSVAAGVTAAGGTMALVTAAGTVAAGGVVAGAGLDLARQGAEIKGGKNDPTTGKPKTDLNFGQVFTSGVKGGLMAPAGALAFGAVPVVMGGLGLAGGGYGAVNAFNNFTGNNFLTNNNPEKTKNGWLGAADAGESLMALGPMAFKGARNAMFGAEARAQTAQSASRVWNGAGKLAGHAWNGAGNMAGRVFGSGENNLASRAWNGVGNAAGRAWNGTSELAGKAWTGGGELAHRAWTGAGGLVNRAVGGAQNWGSRALTGAHNWGGRAWTGARNWGIRGINTTKNAIYDVKDILSPQRVTPGGFTFGGDRPKDIPLIKNEPLRMQSNNPEGGDPQANKPGSPTRGDNSATQTSQTASENQTGKSTSTPEQRASQSKGFEDPKLTEYSQSTPTTYGKNYIEKFGKHIEQIRRLTGAEIGKKVKTSPETQQQVKNTIDDIIMTGEARTRPWGEYKDAIWSRKGDAIVIRQSNGEFVTFLDGTQPGNVQRWHD